MTSPGRVLGVLCFASALSAHVATAPTEGLYRDYQIGGSLASISALAGVSPADATTIHQRPAILQDLAWRRPYTLKAAPIDPVQAMLFSFYNDQLFRIVADYDRDRTEGMTDADMTQALSSVFGPIERSPAKSARAAVQRNDESTVEISRWSHVEQSAVLYRVSYPPAFRLVVTGLPLEAQARLATAEARRLDEREAPQREMAKQRLEAEAARTALDKARDENRTGFRP